MWVPVAGLFVPDLIYNIGTTVLNGGVSMVIFFFVNKIIRPGKREAMEKISLYERRRRLITVLYERQNDTVGNLAFEFAVSSHTIRNDLRVLELEHPIYTKVEAGGGVFILDSSRLQQRRLTVRQRELLIAVCGALNDEQALLMKSIIGVLAP